MQYKFLSERMVRTFEQTLHALPEVTQRAIVDRLDLVTDCVDEASAKGCPVDSMGAVRHRTLFLDSDRMRNYPHSFWQAVVAHEFAHVALNHTAIKATGPDADHQMDMAADELAGRWGFQQLMRDGSLKAWQYAKPFVTFGEVAL